MKRFTFKSISVKFLALVLSLCACAGVYMLATANDSVKAEEVAVFAVEESASIRDGATADDGYYGLRFTTNVNSIWLAEYEEGTTFTFGTLIFPASYVGNFDETASVDANKAATEAVKFLAKNNVALTSGFSYNASIVYDEAEATRLIKSVYGIEEPTPDQIKTVLNNLYAMDMTAVSYVIVNGEVSYTNMYTTSMLKVAARLARDEKWGAVAGNYIPGKITFESAYVSDEDDVLVVDSKPVDFNSFETIFVGNKTLTAGVDYEVNEGVLTLSQEIIDANIRTYTDVYMLDASGNLTVIEVLFAN
ncbi:MAG: hypothetical protein J6V66_04400, partial [Clostridia bacterium]|nr:hypothetical protein [Clostridia bacterium]